MSILVPKTLSYTFSSNPSLGATNISSDGSSFTINLNNAIFIPSSAVNCSLDVVSANIWYVQPNISVALGNNNFTYIYNAVSHSITIPDGLYSLENLNSYLSIQFVNSGYISNLIVLTGNQSTQQTVLTFNATNLQANFNVANSVRTVLGFNATLVPLVIQAVGYSEFSPNIAAFNSINSFYIRSNIVSVGLPINNISNSIIAAIPITAEPGNLNIYTPNIPIEINCSEIVGNPINTINVQLLDDSLRPAPTNGEYFSFILHIHYNILLTDKKVPLLQF